MNYQYSPISIWLTGISGAGKTTLAKEIQKRLKEEGITIVHFDGDSVRHGLNSDLDFSLEDRKENIRRVSEISKLLLAEKISTINSFIAPTETIRSLSKSIIGNENYFQIYVASSLERCSKNDVKGLYNKANKGLIKNFTTLESPFEPPLNSDFIFEEGDFFNQIDECIIKIFEKIRS